MKLTAEDLEKLSEIATEAAIEAGKLIASYQGAAVKKQRKDAGSTPSTQLVTEVDFESQKTLLKYLESARATFDLGLLTEELPDDGSRFEKDYFWCLDPLDGTLPFTEERPGYAVSIALVSQKGESLLGVVYDPLAGNLYHAIKSAGAFRNKEEWTLRNKEGASLKIFHAGGAVMNACWVFENGPAMFFKKPKPTEGGGCVWDYAATACIAKELGAWVSDASGEPLALNRKSSPYMNECGVLFASSTDLGRTILKL